MSKDTTLDKVNHEISHANLGKARDRLHGLISAYPNDLDLRPMLAEIYFKLQQPAMAGRYWYLEENRTEEMQWSREEFEKSSGHDQLRIWLALKFKGDFSALPPGHAKDTLTKLFDACREKHPRYFESGLLKRKNPGAAEAVQWGKEKYVFYGCLVVLATAVALMVVGLITMVKLVF